MKNKSGLFLAEETLKIVVAVIVISFLIYFIASLYFSGKDSEEMRFAESSAKYFVGQMNAQAKEVQIFNPEGWIMAAWKQGSGMPLACSNLGWKNCVCICDKKFEWFGLSKSTPLENCDEVNYCAEYSKEIFINEGSIEIDNSPITLELNYGDKIEVNKK